MGELKRTLEKLDENKKTLEETRKNLKSNKKNERKKIVVFLSNEFQRLRKIKSISRKKIRQAKKVIKADQNRLEVACEFDFEDLTNFLTSILSVKENDDYIKRILYIPRLDLSNGLPSVSMFTGPNTRCDSVCLITTTHNFEKLESLSMKELSYLYYNSLDKVSEDGKYILLGMAQRYSFYRDDNVDFSKFKRFSYVEDIISKIIEERLTTGIEADKALDKSLCDFSDDYVKSTLVKKGKE